MRRILTITLFASALAAQSLDFDSYRSQVEPVFLKKRPGHARCVSCHVDAATAFRLQKLNPGAAAWTQEQSRRNFEVVVHLVTPGDPSASRLLKHPLAPDAGGDKFHGGGRQFSSTSDEDYRTIAAWINEKR